MMNRHRSGVGALVLALALGGCGARDSGGGATVPAALGAADAAVAAAQRGDYSVNVCVECGKDLPEAAVELVQDGKLVRLCSTDCAARFAADPVAGLAARDEALIASQLPGYPTDQCVVMEESIDVMGTPKNVIVGARLVRFCCDTCIETFQEDPAKYLAALDEAAKHPVEPRALSRTSAD